VIQKIPQIIRDFTEDRAREVVWIMAAVSIIVGLLVFRVVIHLGKRMTDGLQWFVKFVLEDVILKTAEIAIRLAFIFWIVYFFDLLPIRRIAFGEEAIPDNESEGGSFVDTLLKGMRIR